MVSASLAAQPSAPPLAAVTGRVLVIEHDPAAWDNLRQLLGRAGHRVAWAADGADGLRQFRELTPDLVLLAIDLPVLDGWTVLQRIRDVSEVPVMVVTSRARETEKARGLLGGADDYVTKPFSPAELVARVGALLRRYPSRSEESRTYADRRLEIDFETRAVTADGIPVQLTPTEFRLLALLVRRAGQVLSPNEILEQGWHDPSGIGTGRVKFTVLNLRRKLGWHDLADSPIETVRGFGYRYRSST